MNVCQSGDAFQQWCLKFVILVKIFRKETVLGSKENLPFENASFWCYSSVMKLFLLEWHHLGDTVR